jgi:hypothetical protein
METLVREEIIEHMKLNKLFSKKQFGFISGRSTVLQKVLDKWTEILDKGVDIIYCDFMKAFDKVTSLHSDFSPFTMTLCFLPSKNDLIHPLNCPVI